MQPTKQSEEKEIYQPLFLTTEINGQLRRRKCSQKVIRFVKRGDKSVRRNSVSRELESLNKDGVDSMSSADSEKVN